jgi:peroxiredoxin
MQIKPLLFFIAVVSLALFIVFKGVGPSTNVKIGEPAPDFTIKDESGKEVKLSDFRGSLVFLNIWATWCVPCVDEMPEMELMKNAFKDRKFQMMAVSLDTEWDAVKKFYDEHSLTIPVYLDPGRNVYAAYKATGVPETFVIDRNGILIQRYIGQKRWSTPQMMGAFDAMIKEQETAQSALQ